MVEDRQKTDLAKIVEHGNFYNTLGKIKENPTDANQINSFLDYFQQTQNPSEETVTTTHNLIWSNPAKTAHYVMPYIKEHQEEIIKQVSNDTKAVLSELGGQTLQKLAEPYIGDQEYQIRTEISRKGTDSDIRNATITMHGSRLYREIAAGSSTEALKTALGNKLTRDKNKYMIEDLGMNPETGEVDKSQAAGYLAPKMQGEKEKLQIGLIYTQSRAAADDHQEAAA